MQLSCKNDLATFGAKLGNLGNFLFDHLVTLVVKQTHHAHFVSRQKNFKTKLAHNDFAGVYSFEN